MLYFYIAPVTAIADTLTPRSVVERSMPDRAYAQQLVNDVCRATERLETVLTPSDFVIYSTIEKRVK
jgi:hypothetical protein